MQLYIIRHGQSQNNALWDRTGSSTGRSHDPELTETGHRQAKLLADFISSAGAATAADGQDLQNSTGFGLTHLYTSLMLRAVDTGSVIAHALGLPLTAWMDLHEGGGIYLYDETTEEYNGLPGNSRSFFAQNYPQLILPEWLDESGWWNRPFETRPERRARAQRVLTELQKRHGNTNDRVAFFSHAGFYNHMMCVLLGLPLIERSPSQTAIQELSGDNIIFTPERDVWFNMNNVGMTRLDFTPDEVKLCYHNRVDFLPRDLIT